MLRALKRMKILVTILLVLVLFMYLGSRDMEIKVMESCDSNGVVVLRGFMYDCRPANPKSEVKPTRIFS